MKVLLYSHSFYPSIGGIETVSMALAEGFLSNGITLKVITRTADIGDKELPFEVLRNPDRQQQIDLVRWADVVLFNGASLALQPWIILYRKPFVWIHTGYQVSCIDGLGWVNGKRAPLDPWRSFLFHKDLKGWNWGLAAVTKLLIRRTVAKHMVAKNIAITEWMLKIQALPRQVCIYNPFPINGIDVSVKEHDYDFLYLGRIVSEKGVLTLLKAFSKVLLMRNQSHKLLIVGDGDWRKNMEIAAKELGISNLVTFAGSQTGDALLSWLSKGKIGVIPSEWYEAMGGVALELMSLGKNLIVSEKGGLRECVGNAALTFPNGDYEALAECMCKLLDDTPLREAQLLEARERIKLFNPSISVSKYVSLLKNITSSN